MIFSVLTFLLAVSGVIGHFDGFNDASNVLYIEPGHNLNTTDSHRRLTDTYLSMIETEVTNEKLQRIIKAASGYALAKPFPHMSASDIFPMDVLMAVHNEIPDNPKLAERGCVEGSRCYNSKREKAKNAFHLESNFGPATKALFSFMKSRLFLGFLEKVSGIEGLIADGTYRGAGIHQTLPGGHLDVHADFNLDVKNNLHRRVNAFIYLNPDWKEEYGGHLELWSRDLKTCEARILPDIGRLVFFSSTDFSYHGHQSPLACPKDRSRRSLAMYYYTKTRPSHECLNDNCEGVYHSTLFQKTLCPECSDSKCYVSTA